MRSTTLDAEPKSLAEERATPGMSNITGNVELLAAFALLLYLAAISSHMLSIDVLLGLQPGKVNAFEQSFLFGEPLWPGSTSMTSKYGLGLSLIYVPGLLSFSWLRAYAPVPTVSFGPVLFYTVTLYTVAPAPLHAAVIAITAYLVALLCREMGMSHAATLWGLPRSNLPNLVSLSTISASNTCLLIDQVPLTVKYY